MRSPSPLLKALSLVAFGDDRRIADTEPSLALYVEANMMQRNEHTQGHLGVLCSNAGSAKNKVNATGQVLSQFFSLHIKQMILSYPAHKGIVHVE